MSFDKISRTIAQAGITPSVQRIKILEYLHECQCHPTADKIFSELKNRSLGISKATVYNTLNLFAKKGLVRVLITQDNENRFDILTHDHGHFVCDECGKIFDFDIDIDKTVKVLSGSLDDYWVNQKDIYFKGVCKKCIVKKQKINRKEEKL